jgi:hypothetical protein
MKAQTFILIPVLSLLLTTSCFWQFNETVVGKGDVESMDVSVAEFSGVTVTGTCNVDIVIGEEQKVELRAQPEILDVMTYEVKSGILHIGFRRDVNVNTDREIAADIVIPSLNHISVTGAGNFTVSGESQPSLDIHITGTGDVDALNMSVDDCWIVINGAGNCEVTVNDNLDVDISGVGNVYYRGNPSLSSDISGVGNVVAIGN